MGIRTAFAVLAILGSVTFGEQARAACALSKAADLPVTMVADRALIPVKLNGADARFMVDSGAFFSMISPGAVAKYHVELSSAPFGLAVQGVGGQTTNIARGTVKDFFFAGVALHDIDFVVGPQAIGGAEGSIGQNLLQIFDVEYNLGQGSIRLLQSKGCDRALLAYWVAPDQAYSMIPSDRPDMDQPRIGGPLTVVRATLNGASIRVLLDTGSPRSSLTLRAAARAGVKPTDPGVIDAGVTSGVAARSYLRVWLAPFSSFKIGDEEVKNFKILIGDTQLDGQADMLLGADFFMSHRVLVANSQHQVYFTYSGGPVFSMTLPSRPASAALPQVADKAGGQTPLDAEGYDRLAAASNERRDYAGAIAYLTHAIELNPSQPRYFVQRGVAELQSGQPLLSMTDLNEALKLKPDYVLALVARSNLHLQRNEPADAKADLDAADKAAVNAPDERLRIAEAYERQQFEPEAIAELDQWIVSHPDDDRMSEALNRRCWIRALQGQSLDKALADCNAALKLTPGDPPALNSRGLVLLRMGQFDKAISDYNAVLKLSPNTAWSLYGRGLAKLRKGMKAEGQADLQAAAAMRPQIAADAAKRGLTP